MKITKSDAIQAGEKEFIDTINAELDWEAIEKMLMEKHKLALQDDVDYKKGDLVVYKNQIAYQLDFEIKVGLSILFDRNGECLEITTTGDAQYMESDDSFSFSGEAAEAEETAAAAEEEDDEEEEFGEAEEDFPGERAKKDGLAGMASNLADMMKDINREDEA